MKRKSTSAAMFLGLGSLLTLLVGCGNVPLAPTTADLPLAPGTGTIRLTLGSNAPILRRAAYSRRDVARLQATLSGGPLANPQVTQALYGGPDLRFDALQPGTYDLDIQALGTGGSVIGEVHQPAIPVQAGEVATVQMVLRLNPDGSIPAAGSGSGAVGNLQVGLTVVDNNQVSWPLP